MKVDSMEGTPEQLAIEANKNKKLLENLLKNLISKDENVRYRSFQALQLISEENPKLLYPSWNYFEDLLRSTNHYHKLSAIILIANLTAVDDKNKFENFYEEFYSNFESEKTVTPIYLALYSGKIAKAKSHLQNKITDKLLNIESIHKGKQIELIKSAMIESFNDYFEESTRQSEIVDFVKKQLESSSPKTRKIAKEFLERWIN